MQAHRRNSQIKRVASGRVDSDLRRRSRNLTSKQHTNLSEESPIAAKSASRGSLYSNLASSAKKCNSKSPILTKNRPVSRETFAATPSAKTDKLTAGIKILKRRWASSCIHLWSIRIASSAEDSMFIFTARDFGFDQADALASAFGWRCERSRRILREIWEALNQQLSHLQHLSARS